MLSDEEQRKNQESAANIWTNNKNNYNIYFKGMQFIPPQTYSHPIQICLPSESMAEEIDIFTNG
jgi:hypothetical protein